MTFVPIERGTLNWDEPVNTAFTEQDARITTNETDIDDLQIQITENLDDQVYNVKNHGAVGDGVTDDSAAINALIDLVESSGTRGTIYFPRGTYLVSSPLTPTKPARYTGDNSAVIKSSANDIFDFAGNYMHPGFESQVDRFEIDHLVLDATGGHCFNNVVMNQASFHDLILHARSSDKGVWNSSGTLLEINFQNIISTVYGATRTFPAWKIVGISTADVAGLAWNDCLFQNNDKDDAQYQVYMEATNAGSARYYVEQISFRDCYFERPFGGAVKILSGHGVLFINCRTYDIFDDTVGNSSFYMGKGANSTWPSTNTTFIGCGRDLQGPDGSSTWDIQLESDCIQTTIQNFDVRDIPSVFDGHPFLNLGNSASVTLINNAEQTLTNANGTGFNNITPDGSRSGALAPTIFTSPEDGYLATSFPAEQVSGTGIAPGNGVVNLVKILVRAPISVTNVALYINTAGATLTAGQNFAGIYNSAGTRVATSADLSAAWAGTGWMEHAMVGGPVTLNPGFYWVAIMSNATTRPAFGKNNNALSSALYNGKLTAANMRFATNGTGTTALPTPITPASNVGLNVPFWVGLT